MILADASSARNGSMYWSGWNDEGTLAVPAVRDMVDLGNSPWRDHSAEALQEVREASPHAASPPLVGPWPTSAVETSCAAESRTPLRAAA